MAPPPEYDKEPKAPDKSAITISTEELKLSQALVTDKHTNSDHKPTNTVSAAEVENKHVETLDDGQLKALLDEAINYKNPKDREGKSKIFKELLEEVEQESDEQACEAAARALSGCRSARRGGRRGPPLPHSNSLQDLVAALSAEPPRRHHARHHHTPAPSVSARAIHGGSLPSGVDTSSLSEEPVRGAGYLATVRCVNPPPLAERRVSASDANTPAEIELLNRRSKPMFPMTYTARATLEIGSGAVCSGRAVTTTTSSNQVRTPTSTYANVTRQVPATDPQTKLMNALCPTDDNDHGGGHIVVELRHNNVADNIEDNDSANIYDHKGKTNIPRGPKEPDSKTKTKEDYSYTTSSLSTKEKYYLQKCPQSWVENVDNWYKSLSNYSEPFISSHSDKFSNQKENKVIESAKTKDFTKSNLMLHKKDTAEDKELIREPNSFTHSPVHNKAKVKKESSYSLDRDQGGENNEYSSSILKKKTKGLVAPNLCDINPKNVRPMSIAQRRTNFRTDLEKNGKLKLPQDEVKTSQDEVKTSQDDITNESIPVDINSNTVDVELKDIEVHTDTVYTVEDKSNNSASSCLSNCCCTARKQEQLREVIDMFNKLSSYKYNDIELKGIKSNHLQNYKRESFAKYVSLQQKLLIEIESLQEELKDHTHIEIDSNNQIKINQLQIKSTMSSNKEDDTDNSNCTENKEQSAKESLTTIPEESPDSVIQPYHTKNPNYIVPSDSIHPTDLSNNAYILLTSPSSNNNTDSFVPENTKTNVSKKKELFSLVPSHTNKKEDMLNKNILKILLFENIKNNVNEKSGTSGVSSITSNEVDSAISFSCITTPEVVASCNTTSSSTSHSAVAVDPKVTINKALVSSAICSTQSSNTVDTICRLFDELPTSTPTRLESPRLSTEARGGGREALTTYVVQPLQLDSSYRAMASVTGDSETTQPGAADPPARSTAQPRNVISSSFNGLPLSRPNYGSTTTSATDDYKKSLDENGNSVQGFSSPLSGSSQHKKPRRKKSSKNETVIDCQQIDGYQGDKDVNELLRFIESNADNGRGTKLARVKHKDDSDDKSTKKRSTERRKDKENKIKRATSLEELSRTKIEDLTDVQEGPLRAEKKERRDHPPAKQERRSWGDDTREVYEPAAAELTDFQTVTKKRKPRRRADDTERDPPRRARPPSPPPSPRTRRESAPPSDRSNDSNDDMDSVHSLPDASRAQPITNTTGLPPLPPHASYAEIARTRHNIPDLIESCNFYAEGESGNTTTGEPTVAPADVDGYPALEVRTAAARRRDTKTAGATRRDRKERAAAAAAAVIVTEGECPAPDVVGERRPAVILVSCGARPRDMDGVTFGFDINEQLVSDVSARRPRCDLVRDALDCVHVRAGRAAIRYMPPETPAHTTQLMQIVDYVGNAWEDVVRCGAGKVRYFSD